MNRRLQRRSVLRATLGLPLMLAFASCATAPPPAPARASVVIVCAVPDASVWVDDRYAGPASTWARGNSVLAGFRRIEVRHPDHFSFFAEVNPKPGEVIRLSPLLRPLLD